MPVIARGFASASCATTVHLSRRPRLRTHSNLFFVTNITEWLAIEESDRDAQGNLSWVADSWWRLLTSENKGGLEAGKLHRRHFEVCMFTQLMWDLKSGDICIVGMPNMPIIEMPSIHPLKQAGNLL